MNRLKMEDLFEKLGTIDFRELEWKTELTNNVNSLEKLKQYVSLTAEEENLMQEVLDNIIP